MTGWSPPQPANCGCAPANTCLFGATFGDLLDKQGPVAIATGTDLSTGSRLAYFQNDFDLLCSNLNSVHLARAAATSSAVPVAQVRPTAATTTTSAWVSCDGYDRRPGRLWQHLDAAVASALGATPAGATPPGSTVHRDVVALVQKDAGLAASVRKRDIDIDQIYNTLFRSLFTYMMESPGNIGPSMHLHFIAKNIERVGDHATAVAEQVIYLATGDLPEDTRPKGESVPRLTTEGA